MKAQMAKPVYKLITFCLGLCVALCLPTAQAQMYKYLDKDGRTVYSDQEPPTDATKVEQKRLNKNYIDTSGGDYELQQAAKRQPLTLYTTEGCADPCSKARTYLTNRGTPFTESVVTTPDQAKLISSRLGAPLEVPLLDVGGNTLQKGFEESAWEGLLVAAGYPRRTKSTAATAPQPKAK